MLYLLFGFGPAIDDNRRLGRARLQQQLDQFLATNFGHSGKQLIVMRSILLQQEGPPLRVCCHINRHAAGVLEIPVLRIHHCLIRHHGYVQVTYHRTKTKEELVETFSKPNLKFLETVIFNQFLETEKEERERGGLNEGVQSFEDAETFRHSSGERES